MQAAPPNHLVKAILATLFCCLPFGVVAIVFAAQVNGAVQQGDMEHASELSGKANFWGNLSIGIGVAIGVIYVLLMVLGIAGAAAA